MSHSEDDSPQDDEDEYASDPDASDNDTPDTIVEGNENEKFGEHASVEEVRSGGAEVKEDSGEIGKGHQEGGGDDGAELEEGENRIEREVEKSPSRPPTRGEGGTSLENVSSSGGLGELEKTPSRPLTRGDEGKSYTRRPISRGGAGEVEKVPSRPSTREGYTERPMSRREVEKVPSRPPTGSNEGKIDVERPISSRGGIGGVEKAPSRPTTRNGEVKTDLERPTGSGGEEKGPSRPPTRGNEGNSDIERPIDSRGGAGGVEKAPSRPTTRGGEVKIDSERPVGSRGGAGGVEKAPSRPKTRGDEVKTDSERPVGSAAVGGEEKAPSRPTTRGGEVKIDSERPISSRGPGNLEKAQSRPMTRGEEGKNEAESITKDETDKAPSRPSTRESGVKRDKEELISGGGTEENNLESHGSSRAPSRTKRVDSTMKDTMREVITFWSREDEGGDGSSESGNSTERNTENRPDSAESGEENGGASRKSENREENEGGGRENEGTMTGTPGEEEDYNDFANNGGKSNNGRNEEVEEGEGGEANEVGETLDTDRRVVIEWDVVKKPFLGGFRHKHTGVEYHHASTQTYRPTSLRVLQKMLITKYHRDTQTTETAHNKTQPLRECGTQMARTGLYISDEGAKTMAPRPYFTADQLFDLKTRKAIKIQCMARRWFAKRKVQRLREARAETEEQLAVQQEEKQRELDAIRQREIERRRNPRTKEDFDVLYRELEAWHQQETARIIESTEDGSETRKGEMYALLQKQTQLLQTIDRLKLQAAKANQGPKIAKNLAQMAAPKQWGSGGVQVTTPFTKRAEELMVLYHGLKEPLLTVDQRLDVLLHVKWTVKEFSTQLTKDIIELIDREADLLNRGRSEKSVEALRQRISNMFLRFIETPEFNPEAANLKTNKIKKVST